MLMHCLDDSEASVAWNKTLFKGVCILVSRIEEVRPFLQPRQITPQLPFGLPQPPIARISDQQVPEVVKIAETIQEAMADEVGDAALNGDLTATVGRAVEQIQDAAADANPSRRLSRMRANVTKLVFVAGGITAATGAGVMVN